MFVKVKTFFENNSAGLAPTPVVGSTLAPALNDWIEKIYAADAEATSSIKAVTQTKTKLREELELKVFSLSGALRSYFTLTAPDPQQAARCTLWPSHLKRMRATELYTQLRMVMEMAEPVKALLAPFGWAAADVDAVGAQVDRYLGLAQSPREATRARVESKDLLTQHLAATTQFLNEQADPVMQYYALHNQELYDYYQRARAIDQSGGGRADGWREREITFL